MSSGSSRVLLRVDRHLVALSAAAVAGVGIVGIAEHAQAAIVYSGTVNINAPADFSGIYLNMETGATGRSAASVPGWDINPWVSSAQWRIFPATTGPGGVVGSATAATNLNNGDAIGPAQTYGTSSALLLPNGSPALVGIRFATADASIHYGWAHITSSNSPLTPATIVDYAWENTANTAIAAGATGGTTPEPASLGLLALGAVGLLRRRSA